MKFRMFDDMYSLNKIAVNVDHVLWVDGREDELGTTICMANGCKLNVKEDYQTVFSRLNTIAE